MKLYFSLKSIYPDRAHKFDRSKLVFCIDKSNSNYNSIVMHTSRKGSLNTRGGWREIEIKKIG